MKMYFVLHNELPASFQQSRNSYSLSSESDTETLEPMELAEASWIKMGLNLFVDSDDHNNKMVINREIYAKACTWRKDNEMTIRRIEFERRPPAPNRVLECSSLWFPPTSLLQDIHSIQCGDYPRPSRAPGVLEFTLNTPSLKKLLASRDLLSDPPSWHAPVNICNI